MQATKQAVAVAVADALTRVKISRTSKLGTISWSLEARETCPGSLNKKRELVDACAGCYAAYGNYVFANVKAPRAHNKEDWQRDGWVTDMVTICQNESHVRWFDSGDTYHIKLAVKMYYVMVACPDTLFWLPTRMYKFAKFRAILERIAALPNVMVRYSSDSILGEFEPGLHGSVIYPAGTDAPQGTFACPAYKNDGKCGSCRTCYDKSVPVIAYPTHGRVMTSLVNKRIIQLKLAA